MLSNRVGYVLAAMLALVVSACEQPRPIPPGTDRIYYGHLLEGEKFGVSVGMSQEEAVRILVAQGLRGGGQYECTSSTLYYTSCNESSVVHAFRRADFLKDGMVYLEIKEGVLCSISWRFAMIRMDT